MPANPTQRRPGDLILDRYMLNATAEEREDARENLRALVRVLMRIDRRLTKDAVNELDSHEVNAGGKI
jgi:hypothetical protein